MRIPKLEKALCPSRYVHLAEAIRTLGKARFRKEWLEQRYVKKLPYHIGKTVGRGFGDVYVWRFKAGCWEPDEKRMFFTPERERKERKIALQQFHQVVSELFMAVERNRVGLRFRNVSGDHAATKALKGLLVGQGKYVRETGRLRIRTAGKKDELWYVFFEKKGLDRLARGDGARTWRDEYKLTADESVDRAKALILEAIPAATKQGIALKRDEILDIVDRVLKAAGGAMPRSLFDAKIWRKPSEGQSSWFEQQKFEKLAGKQGPFRAATAAKFVNAFVEGRKKMQSSDAEI